MKCAVEFCHNEAGPLPVKLEIRIPQTTALGTLQHPQTKPIDVEFHVCAICENAMRLGDVRGLSL